jgi:hypothetical protein
MTYTFKLARRLAVSRTFGMLPALLLFAACTAGDATAPESSTDPLGPQGDWRPRETTPVTVSVNPSSVTVETNQLIRFLAYGRNNAGDSVYAPITWQATGGTILPDGRFSSAAVGTFQVTGHTRVQGEARIDTSIVEVVRRQPLLLSIQIAPATVTLAPGLSQTFLATGRLKDGRAVPVGVTWNATGGGIDAGGNYVAGDTAGTYQVIATNTSMTLADTATVTITAPPPPPPPPAPPAPPAPAPPEEPPAPVLEKVTLVPASATLAPAATRRFTAYGRTTSGDSVAVSVVFTATGGSVTAGGLYTAGSTPGTYRIIAKSGTLADTSSLTVTRPLGSGPATGMPFGPFNAWVGNSTLEPNAEVFTLSIGSVNPTNIRDRIEAARARGTKLILAMTGGGHHNYMTDGVFDMAKWQSKMDLYNTSAIRTAVSAGLADGTIIGNVVMDEPHVTGAGDGNTWGPKGTMTKLRVDQLCRYVKTMFPSMAVGVIHGHNAFEPDKSYQVCEFLVSQFVYRLGDVTKFRDAALAMAARDGMAIVFSMNIKNGGIQAARDGLWNCPPTTGGRGSYEPTCSMTAAQVREWGTVLGTAGCALTMWRYDDNFMAKPENQQAFKDLAARLATVSPPSCKRP